MSNTSPFIIEENKDTREAHLNVIYRLSDKDYLPSAIELALQLLIEDGKVFASRKDMADKCANLYGMTYSSSFSHHEGYYYVYFSISSVDEAYIKTLKNLRFESIKLLQKVIISGIKNTPGVFARLKSDLVLQSEDIISSPSFLVLAGIKQYICKDFIPGELRYGTNKAIMETTLSDINIVLEAFKSSPYEIVYLGRTTNNIKEKIASLFPMPSEIEKRTFNEFDIEETKDEEGTTEFSQSQLALVYKVNKINDEKEYVINHIISLILSNSPTSRLFQTIRENLHLVYDISSSFYSDKSLMIISAPLKNLNKNITMTNIKKVMEEAKKGIAKEELEEAKSQFKRMLSSISNKPNYKIELITTHTQFGFSYDLEKLKEIVEEIKVKDINEYIKSISFVGSYYLEGRGE